VDHCDKLNYQDTTADWAHDTLAVHYPDDTVHEGDWREYDLRCMYWEQEPH